MKPRVKKIKKNKIKVSSIMYIMLAIIVTFVLFSGLLVLQNKFADEISYKQILIAKQDIPEGIIITSENKDIYFTLKNINILDTTQYSLSTSENLVGKRARVGLVEGESVMMKDFEDLSPYTDNLKDPVEISVAIGGFENTDAGRIREGDLINITLMYSEDQLDSSTLNTIKGYSNKTNEETITTDTSDKNETTTYVDEDGVTHVVWSTDTKENVDTNSNTIYNYAAWAKYVKENLYVYKAMTSDGIEISPSDTTSIAEILIFRIERDEESEFNNAIVNCGNMRISKVIKSNIKDENSKENETNVEIETIIEVPTETMEIITDETIDEIIDETVDINETDETDETLEDEETIESKEVDNIENALDDIFQGIEEVTTDNTSTTINE